MNNLIQYLENIIKELLIILIILIITLIIGIIVLVILVPTKREEIKKLIEKSDDNFVIRSNKDGTSKLVFKILNKQFSIKVPNRDAKIKELIKKNEKIKVAFFHPFCYSGGGGERVLWVAIDTILRKYKNFHVSIYMKETDLSKKEILEKIKNQFNLTIPENEINFIQLKTWKLTVAETYPVVRLLFQNIFSIITGLEGLLKYKPDIFIETVGFGFLNPIAKIFFRCHVVSYVHYPTISQDMIERVVNRVEDVTNSQTITSNSFLSNLKFIYYLIMLRLYSEVGVYTDAVMTNSSWTNNHILKLWKVPEKTTIVYPPCDSSYLSSFDITSKRERQIISIAQFRPEKAHHIQIEAYAKLLEKHPEYRSDPSKIAKLVVIGGCRNENDEKIVENLKSLVKKYNLDGFVSILTNLPYKDLCEYLKTSLIGIHTMKDEHFGISNIEFMASGLIILANKSAGPLLDIVVPDENGNKTGFLASTVEEYADCLFEILEMNEEEVIKLRTCARNHVQKKFSIEKFEQDFLDALLKGL
ncbi:UDP-Glycosyltransferase/glycogen phosphorylase [Piromyces finnis]|uniref:GDP-Man:Man(3)GlcNAc(2)-PP-Dol alpha-1,2-mannosyltransferase n=1 Tax=Piromyces finnis TaxID=1754191 RepID=A0A1Y1V1V1_9FUNG|nr:UDP-Glycosyltransferase/glycogen phosphorylase [Piromyces finnis]|eukprot:ORX45361.1 UDP-Glycosyltransferase/glycogen phosphorylase [Piromyces finnis]